MIAVCPNPYRDRDLKITEEVRTLLLSKGYEVAICPLFAENDSGAIPDNIEAVPLGSIAHMCSLAVIIGGDGTILSAVREMRDNPVPIIGVNLGTMAFMSALEPDELDLILKAAENKMKISCRMMLDAELIRNGRVVLSDSALNDVIIHGHGDCVKITAWCGDEKMCTYSGDGIILATPTGSTGYSMSAGGPIVEPSASNIIVSPICAHTMSSRSFVLCPDREICIRAEKHHNRKAYLSIDGIYATDLENGDRVVVRKSGHKTLMAETGCKSFYENVYEKLT